LLGRGESDETKQSTTAHSSDWVKRLDAAKREMFNPERLIELVPDRYPYFVVAAAGPYHEGQRTINGVYFPKKYAEPLMQQAAAAQARTLAAR
jgi:hypothetical protein